MKSILTLIASCLALAMPASMPASAAEYALTVDATTTETAHAGNAAPDGYVFFEATVTVAGDTASADAALAGSQAEDPDGFPNPVTVEPSGSGLDKRTVVVLVDSSTTDLTLALPDDAGRLPLSAEAKVVVGGAAEQTAIATVTRDGIEFKVTGVTKADSAAGTAAPAGQVYALVDLTVTDTNDQGIRESLGTLLNLVEDGRFPYAPADVTRILGPAAMDDHVYQPNLPEMMTLAFLVPADARHLDLTIRSGEAPAVLPLDSTSVAAATPIAGPTASGLLSASLRAAAWRDVEAGRQLTVDIDLALTSTNTLELVDIPDNLVSLVDGSGNQVAAEAGAVLRRPFRPASIWGGGDSVLGGALQFTVPSGTPGPFAVRVDGVNPPILLPVPENGGGDVADLFAAEGPAPVASTASAPAVSDEGNSVPTGPEGSTLWLARTGIEAGEPITVVWNGLDQAEGAWIAISKAEDGDGGYIDYRSPKGRAAGRFRFDGQPAGNYEIRFHRDNSNDIALRLPFTISPYGRTLPLPPDAPEGLVDVASLAQGAMVDAGGDGPLIADGNAVDYDDRGGFAVIDTTKPVRITLSRPYPIETVTLTLSGNDGRSYGYQVEGSPDLVNWETLADVAGTGESRTVDTHGKSYAGFRLTNLRTSADDGQFRMVEFAAFAKAEGATPPAPPSSVPPPFVETSDADANIALPAFGTVPFANRQERALTDGYFGADYVGQADPGDGELGMRFDRPYRISTLVVHLSSDAGQTYRFRVEGAAGEDDDWFEVADLSQADQSGTVSVDLSGAGTLRRLRLVGERTAAPDDDRWLSVSELEAHTADPLPFAAMSTRFDVADDSGRDSAALYDAGGRVVAVSSQSSGYYSYAMANDGIRKSGWSVAEGDTAPSITLSLPGSRPSRIDAVELYAGPRDRPRIVDVLVDGGDGTWTRVGRFGLGGWDNERLSFAPVPARFVRLDLIASYGDRPSLGEVIVRETPDPAHPSTLAYVRPGYAGGMNVASAASGGKVIAAAPLTDDADFQPQSVIDGTYTGWAFHGEEESPQPPFVTVLLNHGTSTLVGGAAFSPASGDGAFTTRDYWANRVELWLSDDTPESGFEFIGRYKLDFRDEVQVVGFEPRQAKFARVVLVGSNAVPGSGNHAGLGELEILAEPSQVASDPHAGPNILDYRFGGHLVVPAGQSRTALIDSGPSEVPWSDGTGARPVTLTFGFKGSRPARISSVGIDPANAYPQATWATLVKVLVSNSSVRGFTPVGELRLEPRDAIQYLDFAPIEARYVQLRLIENGGDASMTLGDVYVGEALGPGELSVAARRVLPDPGEDLPARTADVAPPASAAVVGDVAEQEPNNDEINANPLTPEKWMGGTISPLGDTDWYGFDVAGGAPQATLITAEENPQLRVGLKIASPGGSVIYDAALASRRDSHAESSLLLDEGRYFAAVSRPKNSVIMIVDRSDSVSSVRPQIAAASAAFAAQAPDDEDISFVAMDGEVFNEFSSDKAVLADAAARTAQGGGGSPVYEAIAKAVATLKDRAGNKAVIIITDGEDSGSSDEPLFSLWRTLAQTDVRVYTIGYGPATVTQLPDLASTGGDMLREFSIATGGRHYLAPDGDLKPVFDAIAADLGSTSDYRLRAGPVPGEGTLAVVAARGSIEGVTAPNQIELIFDASGSMAAKTADGVTRMAAAKKVLHGVVDGLPKGTSFALRVYGHRLKKDPKSESCRDSELVVPFGALDRDQVNGIVDGLVPRGQTPIGLSLAQLGEDFAGAPGRKIAILITDGIESCATDPNDPLYPVKVVEALRGQDIELRVDVVSLDIPKSESATRELLKSIAAAGDGQYFDTKGAAQLTQAIAKAFRLDFEVRDDAGRVVLRGRVGDPPATLPAGIWTVVLNSATPQVLGRYTVNAGDAHTISLEPEGDGYIATDVAN